MTSLTVMGHQGHDLFSCIIIKIPSKKKKKYSLNCPPTSPPFQTVFGGFPYAFSTYIFIYVCYLYTFIYIAIFKIYM
jgi:hypothetical protein